MGSQPSPPSPITPGQSAQAAVGTAGAGEMMSIANQPIEQAANLQTTEALGPAESQTQGALQARSALQGAQAQRAIQSQVDPMAYAQREMRLKAATDRLGQLYGQNPSAFSFSAPGAFAMPGPQGSPSLSDLTKMGQTAASNISTAAVNAQGGNPVLVSPSNPQNFQPMNMGSYY